jgi:hypothetical protein
VERGGRLGRTCSVGEIPSIVCGFSGLCRRRPVVCVGLRSPSRAGSASLAPRGSGAPVRARIRARGGVPILPTTVQATAVERDRGAGRNDSAHRASRARDRVSPGWVPAGFDRVDDHLGEPGSRDRGRLPAGAAPCSVPAIRRSALPATDRAVPTREDGVPATTAAARQREPAFTCGGQTSARTTFQRAAACIERSSGAFAAAAASGPDGPSLADYASGRAEKLIGARST